MEVCGDRFSIRVSVKWTFEELQFKSLLISFLSSQFLLLIVNKLNNQPHVLTWNVIHYLVYSLHKNILSDNNLTDKLFCWAQSTVDFAQSCLVASDTTEYVPEQ